VAASTFNLWKSVAGYASINWKICDWEFAFCAKVGLGVRAGRSAIFEVQPWGKKLRKKKRSQEEYFMSTVRSWGYISTANDFLPNKDDGASIEDKW
jgi:hypothetical protein